MDILIRGSSSMIRILGWYIIIIMLGFKEEVVDRQ